MFDDDVIIICLYIFLFIRKFFILVIEDKLSFLIMVI